MPWATATPTVGSAPELSQHLGWGWAELSQHLGWGWAELFQHLGRVVSDLAEMLNVDDHSDTIMKTADNASRTHCGLLVW
ncbi:hypothetical protein LSAT2_016976 [Lamellibrachia satsuma]|nr:hypothetical protein LSAT2_016976 [Lamellibrachia satsuma]